MKETKKGALIGAGISAGVFLVLFVVLFLTGFFAKPLSEDYKIEDGEKLLMFETITHDGKMYVPLDVLSFLLGQEASIDKDTGKITFGGNAPESQQQAPRTKAPETVASTALAAPEPTPAARTAPAQPPVDVELIEDDAAFYEKYGGDILLECDKEIVYSNKDDEWQWTQFFSSASGKRIELESMIVYLYTRDYGTYNHEPKMDKNTDSFAKIAGWSDSATLEPGVKKELPNRWYPASGNTNHTWTDYYVYGHDEDGKEVRGCLRVRFSAEVRE